MKTNQLKTINSEALRRYFDSHHEDKYMLIDVRQPVEYEKGHIPGSLLHPLHQLIQSFAGLPRDKDIIFYCHVGSRSKVAAMMAAEEQFFNGQIYSLEGGISAWTGKILDRIPRVGAFNKSQTLSRFLETAMNMEKGAERFYRLARETFSFEGIVRVFDQLADAEISHARRIYNMYLEIISSDQLPFKMYYDHLSGDIVEGGISIEDCMDQLTRVYDNTCMTLLEFALDLEFFAYDLYRTMANQKADAPEMAAAFLDIAQAEKSHMNMISAAIDQC